MRRIAILAEGSFDLPDAKTAVGVSALQPGYRRRRRSIARSAGQDAADRARRSNRPRARRAGRRRFRGGAAFQPDTLLIGIAPIGGRLPDAWRPESWPRYRGRA